MTARAGGLHWFLRRYATVVATAVSPFIVGHRVLDLGAGEGYVGAALRAKFSGWIGAADVGSFRRTGGPYVAYDGTRLPFADAAIDTTLLLLTLHHCADPDRVLQEAVRVTAHRLIVTESVYRNRLDRFWLDFLDHRLNHHRHHGTMPPAQHFKPPDAWTAMFQKYHLTLAHHRWLGSAWERLIHHPLLFVLDKEVGIPNRTTEGAGGADHCLRDRGFPGVPEPPGPGGSHAGTPSPTSAERRCRRS